MMLPGEDGWKDNDSEYAYQVFHYMDDRTWLQMQDSAFYMVGYGDAANTVMAHAVDNSELFAGFAAFGVDNFDLSLLDAAKETESGMAGVTKAEVNVPIWFGAEAQTESTDALLSYWKNANDLNESSAMADTFADEIYIFRPELALDNDMTDMNVAQVRVTIGLEAVTTPEFTDELWNGFLRRVRRQDSAEINGLRAFATNEELGMDYVTLDVEGVTRELWVYVPTAVKSGKVTNVPVVFVYHSGGGSSEEFVNRAGWNKTAEEREFIAVFPTGGRSNENFKASTTWKESDLPFFLAAREYVLENYKEIDATRVYVTGHSMGSIMTHYIALYYPELVAAVAPNDHVIGIAEQENIVDDVVLPYLLNVGDLDHGFVEGGFNYGKAEIEAQAMAARYGNTKTPEETYSFQNGRYYGWMWTNSQGIPVVELQWVRDKIHAMIPEETYRLYDFMANYSRGEDGTSYYMGMPISLE